MKQPIFNNFVNSYIRTSGSSNIENPIRVQLARYESAQLLLHGTTSRSRRTGLQHQVAVWGVVGADQSGWSYHVAQADTTETGGILMGLASIKDVRSDLRGDRIPAGLAEGDVFLPAPGSGELPRLGRMILRDAYLWLPPDIPACQEEALRVPDDASALGYLAVSHQPARL